MNGHHFLQGSFFLKVLSTKAIDLHFISFSLKSCNKNQYYNVSLVFFKYFLNLNKFIDGRLKQVFIEGEA